jgi:hypothetical protein
MSAIRFHVKQRLRKTPGFRMMSRIQFPVSRVAYFSLFPHWTMDMSIKECPFGGGHWYIAFLTYVNSSGRQESCRTINGSVKVKLLEKRQKHYGKATKSEKPDEEFTFSFK